MFIKITNPYNRPSKLSKRGSLILFMVLSVVSMFISAYFVFKSISYVETKAIVTNVQTGEEYDSANDSYKTRHTLDIEYTVNENKYNSVITTYDSSETRIGPFHFGLSNEKFKIGSEFKISYDSSNPEDIFYGSSKGPLYSLILSTVVAVVTAYSFFKTKKQSKWMAKYQTSALFGTSCPDSKERNLYFITDLGIMKKGTCRIEDSDRKVLYEAVPRKNSFFAYSKMEFIDHVSNRQTLHMIGKVITYNNNNTSMWAAGSYSTFDFDGKEIWNQLHQNGIRIETDITLSPKRMYIIYRDNEKIASAVNSNKFVHEEDEGEGFHWSKAPCNLFFRITTREKNLDAIFLTLFVISKTNMVFYY